MRRFIVRSLAVAAMVGCTATASAQKDFFEPPKGKEIYIPRDLRGNDFTKIDSKWSYARMACTDDVAVFWEEPFGFDPAKAPDLEGHDMRVNVPRLLARVQAFYDYFKHTLQFVKTGSNADRYRMMVMLNYSLEGTAYGGDYDGKIGALWIAPNRVQDLKLNCIAHELGHSFQSQITCDGAGEAWGGGGIFEMASQWMLWQVNPEWTTDENYHWRGFIDNHNRRFLSGENIYHSPFVLEYWSAIRGVNVIGDLFRQGKRGEDPASTYMRMFNLSLDQMNNEMTDCYSRLITFDYPRVKESHRKFVGEMVTPMTTKQSNHKTTTLAPAEGMVPETWGFNIVELPHTAKGTVAFCGTSTDANATYKTRVVTVDTNGNAQYGPIVTGGNVKHKVGATAGKQYLVVVGCPRDTYEPYTFNPYSDDKQKEETAYPYFVTIQ